MIYEIEIVMDLPYKIEFDLYLNDKVFIFKEVYDDVNKLLFEELIDEDILNKDKKVVKKIEIRSYENLSAKICLKKNDMWKSKLLYAINLSVYSFLRVRIKNDDAAFLPFSIHKTFELNKKYPKTFLK